MNNSRKNLSKNLVIFFIWITCLFGQSNYGRISGYLKDASNGEPIMYANVVIDGTVIGTASDNHGYYVITNIPLGEHKIKIKMMGYNTESKTLNIFYNDDQRHDFELSTTVIEGEDVTVTAERQRFKEKVEVIKKEVLAKKWNMVHVTEISFIVHYLDFEEFEKMSGVNLNDDFRDLTSETKNTSYKGKERRKEKR